MIVLTFKGPAFKKKNSGFQFQKIYIYEITYMLCRIRGVAQSSKRGFVGPLKIN